MSCSSTGARPDHNPLRGVSARGSFRDPAGVLVSAKGRILRFVNSSGAADLRAFLSSRAAASLFESGMVVRTTVLEPAAAEQVLADPELSSIHNRVNAEMIVEHERAPFPSYPYEWPPAMLCAAGRLTLDIARELLKSGLGLKDGTPYNVLFRGFTPVFIDVLSFERRDSRDPTWLPYAQFVRTFILPLMANKHLGLSLDQILTTRRDGLEPEEVFHWLGPLRKLRPPFLSLVTMPVLLAARHSEDDTSIYEKKVVSNPEKARFILESLLNRLRRSLDQAAPAPGRKSAWSGYMESKSHYTDEHFRAKESFVEQALAEFRPRTVLDIGCNAGHFSALAARCGASVVAIDSDPVVLDEVWRTASSQQLDILALAVDLTRPTPGIGWRNAECLGFLDRARGSFEAVLMLAVIHHMLVTERVPLDDIVDLAAELTTDMALIEFVAPEDPMFRRLTRGREALHKDLTVSLFEASCRRRFEIVRTQHLEGATRSLHLLRKTT